MTTWWWISDAMSSCLFQYSDTPSPTQGRIQSENYQETLYSHLVQFVQILGAADLTFQHGNPSIHASKSTLQWLSSNMGSALSGLTLSRDLNFIENVWGKFINLVYQNCKQYLISRNTEI
ncbi:hypothetical protein AVEN_48468-1 [Araneus ventricosus]|uniref:Tc1-like transposase DDE domain-containing protein n=1 Tax=Araneus ventricosus TaxID=182803 RepID=A0A4Y2KXT3_ARAVE|nr:hypothetical protein AVEN_48468-1 [Araneus ventricosus]